MSNKNLLIKSSLDNEQTDIRHKWNKLENVKEYFQNIELTDGVDKDIKPYLQTMVTGVPSAWARVSYFEQAFSAPDSNTLLGKYYKSLLSQWRGLVSAIAIFKDRISVSNPIYLEKEDIFNDLSSILFEQKDLWYDNSNKKVFVQLISYNNVVIGATCPTTIFFTGITSSKSKMTLSWCDADGILFDPTTNWSADDAGELDYLKKVYFFLKNLLKNFDDYSKSINSNRENHKHPFNNIKSYISSWADELGDKLGDTHIADNRYPVVSYPKFINSFDKLMDFKQKVYLIAGTTFSWDVPDGVDGAIPIDDINLLLHAGDKLVAWRESVVDVKSSDSLLNNNINYLICDYEEGGKLFKFFVALPFSKLGLKIFQNLLPNLLDNTDKINSLTGFISRDGDTYKIDVNLTISIEGKKFDLNSKEFVLNIDDAILNKKVLVWPNFYSPSWNDYYVYNEFPKDELNSHKLIPIFCDKNSPVSKILFNGDDDFATPSDTDAVIQQEDFMVHYSTLDTTGGHKYDIDKYDTPVVGFEFISSDKNSPNQGFIMAKTGTKGLSQVADPTTNVIVGFDFGSNNSAVYYNTGGSRPEPVPFSNRRFAFIGKDTEGRNPALPDELLFFSNETAYNGQVKSWLQVHKDAFLGDLAALPIGKAITGGVPVNQKNVKILGMNKSKIETPAGTLFYNMKWMSDTEGLNRKESFIRSLWMQLSADLFATGNIPTQLNWSYPSAMSKTDIGTLQGFYDRSILNGPDRFNNTTANIKLTEAVAVCSHATSGVTIASETQMAVGLDVGGSTSDIFVIGKRPNNGQELFRQSSVRLAAGEFFKVIESSANFRKQLLSFYNGNQKKLGLSINGLNDILDKEGNVKAPFYLNAIFDQLLEKNDRRLFYTSITDNSIFVLPAYITGALLYYSGKLARKVLLGSDGDSLAKVTKVNILTFGKGGRIFEWLYYKNQLEAKEYYTECFKLGLGDIPNRDFSIEYKVDENNLTKSEVARGLTLHGHGNLIIPGHIFDEEMFVEENIKFDGVACKELDNIDPNMFLGIHDKLDLPSSFENFNQFADKFLDLISSLGYYPSVAVLKSQAGDLQDYIIEYITSEDEYQKAKNKYDPKKGGFEYKAPFFIIEALCYLKKLIKEVYK